MVPIRLYREDASTAGQSQQLEQEEDEVVVMVDDELPRRRRHHHPAATTAHDKEDTSDNRMVDVDDAMMMWSVTSKLDPMAAFNMRRCKDILECQEQIQYWQSRLARLKREHKVHQLIMTIRRPPIPSVPERPCILPASVLQQQQHHHQQHPWGNGMDHARRDILMVGNRTAELYPLECPVAEAWQRLPRKERFRKANLLAVLQNSSFGSCKRHHDRNDDDHHPDIDHDDDDDDDDDNSNNNNHHDGLPVCLQEDNWDIAVPMPLRHDRDLFLARLNRPDFGTYYHDYCLHYVANNNNNNSTYSGHSGSTPATTAATAAATVATTTQHHRLLQQRPALQLQIPDRFWRDKPLILQLMARLPFLVQHEKMDENGWLDDEDMFRALVLVVVAAAATSTTSATAKSRQHSSSSSTIRKSPPPVVVLTTLLGHFSDRLRSRADLMLLAFHKIGSSSSLSSSSSNGRAAAIAALWSVTAKSLRNNADFCCQAAAATAVLFPVFAATTAMTHPQQQQHHRHHRRQPMQWPPGCLKYVSHRLRHDKKVVLGFVQYNGKCLQQAGPRMRRDTQVVRMACASYPPALTYCLPGHAKKKLIHDRPFMLGLFQQQAQRPDCYYNPALWKLLPGIFREDREFVLLALQSHSISVETMPLQFQLDKALWMEALSTRSSLWTILPGPLAKDIDLAKSAGATLSSVSMILDMFQRFADLKLDRDIWLKIDRPLLASVRLQNALPDQLRSDKEIIIRFCQADGWALHLVWGSPLQHDRQVLDVALANSPEAMYFMDRQHQHVDLVIRAIRQTPVDGLAELFDQIEGQLWSRKDAALAWLERGGRWLDELFPSRFESDPDLCLAVAQNNWSEFWYTHIDLCSDKQFMMRAVKKDGRVLLDAEGGLAQDHDLALVAFAQSQELPGLYNLNKHDDLTFLMDFSQHVRSRIAQHQVFVQLIVCSIFRDPGPSCKLPVLNQGSETTAVYLRCWLTTWISQTVTRLLCCIMHLRTLPVGASEYHREPVMHILTFVR